MGVFPKTENEEYAGKTLQIRCSEGGRRGLSGTGQMRIRWRVPRQASGRLTHGLKLDMAMWLLRYSVFGETPVLLSCGYFKELNGYEKCPDCDQCQLCSKSRCRLCRGVLGAREPKELKSTFTYGEYLAWKNRRAGETERQHATTHSELAGEGKAASCPRPIWTDDL